MRANEILNEKPVESTWISDILYNRPNRTVTMRLSNGKSFSIPGVSRTGFEKWLKSPSKGAYFHNFIKNQYLITRLR